MKKKVKPIAIAKMVLMVGISMVVILPLLYLAWGLCVWSLPLPDRPFDGQIWQHAGRCSNVRARMMDNLVKNHGLAEMTAEEVQQLLGPESGVSMGAKVYHLGPGSFVNETFLDLYMRDGKVYDYRIVQH